MGIDALSAEDRLTLEVSRSIREDFLQQDAMSEVDSYCPLDKQYNLIKLILSFEDKTRAAIKRGADIQKLSELPVRERVGRAKEIPAEQHKAEYEKIERMIAEQTEALIPDGARAE